MFVMGIDPGLSRCGYAVVEGRRAGPRAVALGVVTTPPTDPLPTRLVELQRELRALLAEFHPGAVAVERVLFQVNVRTAMAVGQASGIAMAEAAATGCEVVQYSPNQVKDAVAGWGGAGKVQVQVMVQTLLRLPQRPEPPDAADAAALALTHLAFAATGLAGGGPDTGPPEPGRPRNAVARRPPDPAGARP
jgi:crossover junction endodeoxyribonuclease RuvC